MSSSKPDAVESRSRRRVGTTIAGKYRLEEVIGVGGMATVYRGVHRNGNRVAIKMLHAELALEDGLAERFVREGYVANAIDHPGTVRVLDDDRCEDGAAFLVMELLLGETLQQRADRLGGRLAAREILPLFHELCGVLSAAHERGVVHRDIKPENLFVTREGALKVLDFGIARVRDGSAADATQTGRTLGTPAFMPPEQALGRTEEMDGRTDVWAVGATLFTLISGEHVHEARTGPEFVVATATRPARSLASVASETPAMIVEAIDRALRFAKEDRWPSAQAMGDALELCFVEAYGAPMSGAPKLSPSPSTPRVGAPPRGAAPSGSAGEQVTLLAPPSGEQTSPSAGGSARSSGFTTAPTVAVDSARSAQPPGATTQAPERRTVARMALLALLCLSGGLLISLEVQRIWRTSPSAPSAVSASASVSAAPPPACATHRECREKLGRAAICRPDHAACAPLEADGCRILAGPGDAENEHTLWLGAMFPMRGVNGAGYGLPSVNAIDLARRDFMEMTNGLPSARFGGPARPLALVACDDSTEPSRSAAHLVDGMGVPAILGFALSKEVLDLAASVFNPKGVLALASNTASMLRDIPHAPGGPRLVWRTTTSALMEAPAVSALVAELIEPELRASPGLLSPGEAIRVALIRVNNPSGLSYSDLLISGLRFNGKSAAENGANFKVIISREDALEARAEDVATAAAEATAFRPHIIIRMTDSPELIPSIERLWPAKERFRPRYLAGGTLGEEALQQVVKQRLELKTRLFGINTATGGPAIAKFVARYNEHYTPKVDAHNATDAPYDAFYLLAYAAAALGDEAVTGTKLARAIGRLVPPGVPIDVGPGGIYQALGVLRNGQNIDLQGTTTTLDFDRETGEPTADFAVFCLRGGQKGAPVEVIESGLLFVARDGKLRGALRCP